MAYNVPAVYEIGKLLLKYRWGGVYFLIHFTFYQIYIIINYGYYRDIYQNVYRD
jgi:hypothetical protein